MTRPLRLWCASLLTTALLCSTLAAQPAHADPTPPETPPVPATTDAPPAEALEASEEAAATGQPVEIVEWADEYTRTVANPDGTFTLETTREANRIKEGEQWVPIDTTISSDSDGRLRPEATVLDVSFSAGGDRALATTTADGHDLSLETPFELTTPSIHENVITYPDVMPDVDLVVSVEAESYSHVLVVKNREAAQNPELTSLDFTVHTDLDCQLSEDGSAVATDAEGEEIFAASPPVMWDSTSSPQSGDTPTATTAGDNLTAVTIEAAEAPQARSSTTTLPDGFTLTPPTEALVGPDVEYPVYIDPTWYSTSNYFTVVRSGTTSYATGDDLRVGYCNWTGCSPAYLARSYFRFDVSVFNTVAGGTRAKVTKAVVTLTQTHAASAGATPVILTRTTGSFGPWTAYPGPLGSNLSTASTSATGPYEINLDATAYVDSTVYQQLDFVGFGLRASNEADPYQWKKFANNPKLTVTYAYPPAVPAAATVSTPYGLTCTGAGIPSSTVKISASTRIYGPTLPNLVYTFAIYNQGGSVLATPLKESGSVPSGQTASVTVTLPDGKYYVRVKARPVITDGAAFESAYSEHTLFAIETATPPVPEVWSTTHPQGQINTSGVNLGANFTDNVARADGSPNGSITLKSANAAGFLYTWDGGKTPDFDGCTKPKTGYIAATNGQATLPILVSRPKGNNSLKVKAVNLIGHASAEAPTYNFVINNAGVIVHSVEAESVLTTTNTQATSAKASGGKVTNVTLNADQKATLNFTPSGVPGGPQYWEVQFDMTASAGKTIRYQVDGEVMMNDDPIHADWSANCTEATTVGTNSLAYPKLEPKICWSDPTYGGTQSRRILMTTGQTSTISLVAQANGTAISLDKIRFIYVPPQGS
ncbi:hypothetical protein [Tessaracoccus flavescens]|uniref:Uncharacterized protein n=1 Tax=Tessaracoccus flavescens TaxID=399497 RepID=A0A1Q2CXQ8_9ACTN|nr:hypothetical protein [Tessaracoccus flavescens]AQP50861.1 hypothetical protein BW733_08485 [Tessaracoccus flavescens]